MKKKLIRYKILKTDDEHFLIEITKNPVFGKNLSDNRESILCQATKTKVGSKSASVNYTGLIKLKKLMNEVNFLLKNIK